MKRSKIMQQDQEDLIALCKRMTPEQRLVAYFNHAQLVYQIYQAGVRHRARALRQSKPKKKLPKKR